MASEVAAPGGGPLVPDDRRFHNIFHYFRGPSGSGDTYDQQLENNATKALINVLEHSDLAVAQSFIRRFTGNEGPNSSPEILDRRGS